MSDRRCKLFVGLATLIAVSLSLARAEPEAAVDSVRFGTVEDRAGEIWWRAVVTVRVDPDREREPVGWTDRVRVTFWLATSPVGERASAGAAAGFSFYRAEATAVSLAAGRYEYRFYLPPTIVRRDRVPDAPRHWLVDVDSGETALPRARAAIGPGFGGAVAVGNFRRLAEQNASRNDGVLRPEHRSPFATPRDPRVPVMLELSP